MATAKKSRRVKSLAVQHLTSKKAKSVKGGADLLPAVLTPRQASFADGSVRNLSTNKLQKV